MDIQARMKEAMYARKAYIRKNMETLTLKSVRRLLEKDLKMAAGDMDSYKAEAKDLLDRVLAEISADDAKKAPPPAPKANDEKPKPKKSKAQPSVQAAKPVAPGSSTQPPAVQKMQKICKQAGIGVGPNIYRKRDVAAAFQELLAKHGLSAKSDALEIARVKKKLDEQRDMEGIDLSNIVEGGRRNRQQTSWRNLVGADDADDENDEEQPERKRSKPAPRSSKPTDDADSDDDFGELDDARPGKTAKLAKQPKGRVILDDDDDNDDEADEAGRGRVRGNTVAESTNTTAATKAEPPLAELPTDASDGAEEEEEDQGDDETDASSSDEQSDSDDDFDD